MNPEMWVSIVVPPPPVRVHCLWSAPSRSPLSPFLSGRPCDRREFLRGRVVCRIKDGESERTFKQGGAGNHERRRLRPQDRKQFPPDVTQWMVVRGLPRTRLPRAVVRLEIRRKRRGDEVSGRL